jgi:hypothetical protein
MISGVNGYVEILNVAEIDSSVACKQRWGLFTVDAVVQWCKSDVDDAI